MRFPHFFAIILTAWAPLCVAEPEAELFRYEGRSYVRIIVPAGPMGETVLGKRLKRAGFGFALQELQRRGSITPEIRAQIESREAPTEKTGYVLISPVGGHPLSRLDWGPISGVIRADIGVLPFVDRINSLRPEAPIESTELATSFLAPRRGPVESPVVMEPKNYVLRASVVLLEQVGFGGLLMSSLLEKVVPKNIDASFLETDLGALSEFYVRGLGGWSYHRIYSEAGGTEVPVPPQWQDKESGTRRTSEIRKLIGPDKQKHVAVLAADAADLETIRKKTEADPLVKSFHNLKYRQPVPHTELVRFLEVTEDLCRYGYRALVGP